MEIFKVNFKNHIINGWPTILAIIICLVFPYGLSTFTHENVKSFYWIGACIFIIVALPAIIVHLNYYMVNKGDVFEFCFEKNEIVIKQNGTSTRFTLNDIDFVKRSMSFNQAAKRSAIVPWEGYNHSYIQLKNGQKFTITSLLVPDLNLPLKANKIIVKQNFYRLAKKY